MNQKLFKIIAIAILCPVMAYSLLNFMIQCGDDAKLNCEEQEHTEERLPSYSSATSSGTFAVSAGMAVTYTVTLQDNPDYFVS